GAVKLDARARESERPGLAGPFAFLGWGHVRLRPTGSGATSGGGFRSWLLKQSENSRESSGQGVVSARAELASRTPRRAKLFSRLRGKSPEGGMGAGDEGIVFVEYGCRRTDVRPVNPTRPLRLAAAPRSTSPALRGQSARVAALGGNVSSLGAALGA